MIKYMQIKVHNYLEYLIKLPGLQLNALMLLLVQTLYLEFSRDIIILLSSS